MRTLIKEAELPEPKFEFGTFFTVMIRRLIQIIDTEAINEPINEGIKNRLSQELIYIKENGFITCRVVENIGKISTAIAERDITLLKKLNLVKFEGARKTGKHILTEKGKEMYRKTTVF